MIEEKLIDVSGSEHWAILSGLFAKLDKNEIKHILDAGSGKTSLSCLLTYFDQSQVDAVVFPGDERKISSVRNFVVSDRYKLHEYDICVAPVDGEYDLVLAHLLLGEAAKWGNKFGDLLKKLLDIQSRYFVILDFSEDPNIDYGYLTDYLANNGFELVAQDSIKKQEPQEFDDFVGQTYVAFLIKNNRL